MNNVKIIKLKTKHVALRHDVQIKIPQEMEAKPVSTSIHDAYNATAQWEVYSADIKHIAHKGIEHRVALDKDAQELVDMFVELETQTIKDIMINERKLHDIEIDKLHHELRLAKNSWWNKFKSWLS